MSMQMPQSLPIVEEMLSIDSTSGVPNKQLIDLIEAYANKAGLVVHRQHDDSGQLENILLSIPDTQGSLAGGIMLSGHIDTVPVVGQQWTSDPYTPTVRDGKLFARGAADMTGFCAVALHVMLNHAKDQLREPMHLALTYDEETGCWGAAKLVEVLEEWGVTPRACIVGEPTSMEIIGGHKGCIRWTVEVRGLSRHSSLAPQGVNAVRYAAGIVDELGALADRLASTGPFDHAFTVPHTTLSIGRIEGGGEPNIVPDHCTVDVEIRAIPNEDLASLRAEIEGIVVRANEQLQSLNPVAGATIRQNIEIPPLLPVRQNQAVSFLSEAGGIEPVEHKVSYGTEAGIFARAGIDAVVFGPGSIEQAHIADEFIEIEQLARCEQVLDTLIASLHQ